MVELGLILGLAWGSPGGAWPPPAAGKSPLPVELAAEWRDALREAEAGDQERPEIDLLWRVEWLVLNLHKELAPAVHPVVADDSRAWSDPLWPHFAASQADEPSKVPSSLSLIGPESTATRLGLARRQQIEEEPRFFLEATKILLAPATLVVEGLTYLLLPRSISANGQVLFNQDAAHEDLGTLYVRTLVQREINFLAGLNGSYLSTVNVELGTEDVDQHNFHRLQSRVFFDSMKRAYRERYQVPSLDLDTVLNTFATGDWVDFIVVPTLVSVYAARYGIERKWQPWPGVKVQLQVEKGTRFYKVITENHGGRLANASVNLFNMPVSAIVSIDATDRAAKFGFIGIGTDLNVVIEAINSEKPPHELR